MIIRTFIVRSFRCSSASSQNDSVVDSNKDVEDGNKDNAVLIFFVFGKANLAGFRVVEQPDSTVVASRAFVGDRHSCIHKNKE